ncbi:MAG: hypothetical protein KJ077_35760 [Anaerolineae bacterium]|nr:hypothetical protein [Anaerolineae bacterium]
MPEPLVTGAWILAVIGCQKEGVTLDACLIFVPPGTDMAEVLRVAGEAGIPHPSVRGVLVIGPNFDPDNIGVDTMFAYVG